jgi:Serine dehydrogenase proteinase
MDQAIEVLDRRKKISKPPILFRKTQKIIEQIEAELDASFLSYWTSPNGSVCQHDVIGLYEVLQKLGNRDEIILFVKSNGGAGIASLRMVHLLRHYTPRLTALVPLVCASAATMIILGADEIHMGPLAYLTAVDTSMTHDLSPVDTFNGLVSVSQDELTRVIDLWRKEAKEVDSNPYHSLFQYVHPLVIGALDRASSLSTKLCTEILSYHMEDLEKAQKISSHLNYNYPAHSYPITLKEADSLGLNVKPIDPKINNLLLELNKLYSEMGQRALTDFDEHNYHNNEILNILEGKGIQVYYQNDTDWHYRKEERRWAPMNDESSWHKTELKGSKVQRSVFHIR